MGIFRQCVNTGWKALFHMPKVRWGVLGVAGIAVNKVIPAMQRGADTEITAIASRDLAKAQRAARELGIAKAYGSYEELLADRDIDAIYNPLPNHLHVPWSIKAAEAGNHVLWEKPISLAGGEGKKVLEARGRCGVKIGEGFMGEAHPQWLGRGGLDCKGGIRGLGGVGAGIRIETIPVCDQYTVQGDAFSRAIREGSDVPVPLEDAIGNMAVIEAVFRAGEPGRWEKPQEI